MQPWLKRRLGLAPAARRRPHAAAAVLAHAIMREAGAENARFGKTQLARQFADFFLVVVDKLAAGLAVHSRESANRQHAAADALARLQQRHVRAALFERARRGQSGEARADDDDRWSRHTPPPAFILSQERRLGYRVYPTCIESRTLHTFSHDAPRKTAAGPHSSHRHRLRPGSERREDPADHSRRGDFFSDDRGAHRRRYHGREQSRPTAEWRRHFSPHAARDQERK